MKTLVLLLSVILSACGAPRATAPAAPKAAVEAATATGLAARAVPDQPPTTFDQKREMRAGWIVGWRMMTSTAAIDEALDYAEAAGLDTVFAQVRVNADAYYRSDLAPRAETLAGQPADFDPLDYVLRRAHGKGLKVHAWMNAGVVWRSSSTAPVDSKHLFIAHPDWVLHDATGKLSHPSGDDPQPGYIEENYWINWNHPEVKKHLVAVVGELLKRYPVDGVHFDFMRYPGRMGPKTPGAGYDEASVKRFRAETGREPAEHTRAWDEWRFLNVTSVLQACRDEAKRVRPGIPVSAAALAAWNLAYGRAMTGYRRWLYDDVIDFVVLMSYFKDPAQIWQSVFNARETADARRVALGLYLPLLPPQAAARQLLFAREQGLKGWSLFPLDGVDVKDPKEYFAKLRALAVPPVSDKRYQEREPLWNRVAVLSDQRPKVSGLRFFSRTGRTKLVVYPRGAKTLAFSLNDQPFAPLPLKDETIQVDLTPWLKPFERQVAANHDFTLALELAGLPEAYAEVFTVDYYDEP